MSHLETVLSAETLQARIKELAKMINEEYKGEPLVVVCVLKGAFMFFSDLVKNITVGPELEFVRLASYGNGTVSSGAVRFTKDIELDIKDKHVLIVEDVVDSGRSMAFLMNAFRARFAKSLKLCALIDKKERRIDEVVVHFPGFSIEKGYLVGYGMDAGEKYRELDAVYELHFDD